MNFSFACSSLFCISQSSRNIVFIPNNWYQSIGSSGSNDRRRRKGILHSDSQSAIFLAKNPAFHSRTKHIQLRYHFIRSLLDGGQLTLEKILGVKNPADMLTKGVTIEKLKLYSTSVGLLT